MMENLSLEARRNLRSGAILAVVMVVAACIYWFNMVKPQIDRDTLEIDKVKAQIADLDAKLKQMADAEKNWAFLKEKQALLDKLAKKLPNSVDAPGFFQAMVKILAITRIEMTDLTPETPSQRTVYTEIPYKITGRGRYHDFGQFLNLIEENPERFMRVKTLTVENQDDRPSIHNISVRIGTFMFNPRG
jgi:Tfp pilus assembly protein PilO